MNKCGSEKIMSAVFILYLILIGAGVVVLVAQYINSPVDVRQLEAKILYTNFMECITENGYVIDDVFSDGFNVYTYCHLNKNILNPSADDKRDDLFWFNISFVNETGSAVRNSLSAGNSLYQSDCDVNVGKSFSSLNCLYRNESYLFINKTGEIERVRVFTLVVSNNAGKRSVVSKDVL
jgi:hypothetical protein